MLLDSNLKGMQHLGIPVRNIEKSKNWYIEILGFQVIYETKIDSDDGNIAVAFLKAHNLTIEMYQLSGKELEEIKSRKHGHLDHLAFDVDDIEAVYEKLCNAGIKAIEGIPKFLPFWEKGVKFLTILGPDDEKIEFNQKLNF